MAWILPVLFYGICKGIREGCKKKAQSSLGTMEVLFFYTFLSLLLTLPFTGSPFGLPPVYFLLIFLKSAVIFGAWILSFSSIKQMPVSLFGVIDMSGVLFSTLFGIFLLGERMGLLQFLGLCLVAAGLFFLGRLKEDDGGGELKRRFFLMALGSCVLNAVSGTMDKLLMRTGEITAGQLQFWYMLFLTGLYLLYLLLSRTKVHTAALIKNPWIWVMSILFVLADRALFIANGNPDSKVTVMTLLKQASAPASILMGFFFFGEKHLLKRCLLAALILLGIALSLL